MIYKYKAFFTLSDDNETCYVNVPALDYEFALSQDNMSRFGLIRSAENEIGLILYLWEKEGDNTPEDLTDYEDNNCSFSASLRIDTDKIAKNTKIVTVFDFSHEDIS